MVVVVVDRTSLYIFIWSNMYIKIIIHSDLFFFVILNSAKAK